MIVLGSIKVLSIGFAICGDNDCEMAYGGYPEATQRLVLAERGHRLLAVIYRKKNAGRIEYKTFAQLTATIMSNVW